MKIIRDPGGDEKKLTTYQILFRIMTVLAVALLAVVLIVPGVLRVMYRADAQVALGNAKSVKLALETVSTDVYGSGGQFGDISGSYGITDGLETDVYLLAKVPGEFRVLQVDESGYNVVRFQYTENEMMVTYDAGEDRYSVSRLTSYIRVLEE